MLLAVDDFEVKGYNKSKNYLYFLVSYKIDLYRKVEKQEVQ